MEGLGDREVLVLAAGYVTTTVLMVVNAGVLHIQHRQALEFSQRGSPRDLGDAAYARSTSSTSAATRPTRMTTPAVGLCLSVLTASFSELFLSQVSGVALRSKPLTSMVAARIACAMVAVPWLLAKRFYSKERAAPIDGIPGGAKIARLALAGLGLALAWQAGCLAVVALQGFPKVEVLVYVEGFCAIGSLAAISVVWALERGYGAQLGSLSSQLEEESGVLLDAASWTSLLLFSWLNPLFKTGAVRQLRSDDLPDLARKDRTVVWADRFDAALRKEIILPRPSLVRACRLTFGREFLQLGWLKAANTALGFSGPLLLKVVVDTVQDAAESQGGSSKATERGYFGAAGLATAFALSAILDTQFSLRVGRLQLHVRAAIVSAVYRQVLDVRTMDATEAGLTAGSATNLIAVDAQRLMDTAGSLHELWGLPVQVGVTFYLLHREVSFAFAAGLFVIAAMVPLNAALAKRIGAASRELMRHKDDRVQRCSEMLHGIRAVKMLAWEGCVRGRIDASRSKEVSALKTLKYVDAWCVFFWATTPTIVCLVTFSTLVILRGAGAPPLRVSSVFTAISLLQMLIHPMNAFPWVINGIVEANVSKDRLEKLLLLTREPRSVVESGDYDSGAESDPDEAIVSWQGATVTLSRDRVTPGNSPIRNVPNTSSLGGNEMDTLESLKGDILEPLLPPGLVGVSPGEEKGQGLGEDGTPVFSLKDVFLTVRRGEAVAVVGQVGSGKSTLVAGILGEVPVFPTRNYAGRQVNLSRLRRPARARDGWEQGGNAVARTRADIVCYAAQTPWVMSGTVRDNILFGLPMEKKRYRQALEACALSTDLASIPGGDLAYVGERGATLSGGQRLRVSLARCAYRALASAADPAMRDGNTEDCSSRNNNNQGRVAGCSNDNNRSTTGDDGYITSTSTTDKVDNIDILASEQRAHQQRTLCILDDPLTALDADTRGHVVQRCIHGLLRKVPGVAVVVTCGEIDENESFAEGDDRGNAEEKAPLTTADEMDHHDCLISTVQSFAEESSGSLLSHRCFDRVVVLGGNVSAGLRSHDRAAAADTFGTRTGTAGRTACTPLQEATAGAVTGGGGSLAGSSSSSSSSSSGKGSSRSGAASRNTSGSGIAPEGSNDAVAPTGARFTSGAGATRRDNIDPSPTTVHDERHGGCTDEEKAGLLKDVDIGKVHDEREGVQFHVGLRLNNWDVNTGADEGGVVVLGDEGRGGGIETGGNASEQNGGGEENDSGEGPVEEEERKEGSVDARAFPLIGAAMTTANTQTPNHALASCNLIYLLYVRSAGITITALTLLSLAAMQASSAGFRYWLSYWATHQGRISIRSFLVASFAIAAANAAFTLIRAFGFAFGGVEAAIALHRRLLGHVLGKDMAFFDITPSGRIVNRFSRDAFSVDDPLPFHLNVLLAQAAGLLATAVVLSSTSPLLLVLFLPLGVVYAKLQRYYRSSSRELRRLDSTSRSPMYALFSETLDGAVTIRAFDQQELFFARFVTLLAENQRATFAGSMASAWLSLRLQGLGVIVIAAVALLAVVQQQLSGRVRADEDPEAVAVGGPADNHYYGLVGLSLTYALPIVGNLTGLLGALTETEREMISVERMHEYCRGSGSMQPRDSVGTAGDETGGRGSRRSERHRPRQERRRFSSLRLPGGGASVSREWPGHGRLEVSSLVMRYRPGLTPSLNGVSLAVGPGEKVGIVGRTGSGKTSLLRALFRMYPYHGRIILDGVDISTLPAQLLRSRLAIIPQEPLLFHGTIRENLDPSGEYTDADLWQALRRSRLTGQNEGGGDDSGTTDSSPRNWTTDRSKGACLDGDEGGARFGLETELTGDAFNMSAGERQLLCIARALLRRSKLVCVDEATSRMDASTAEMVDVAMAAAFEDATVLSVAHRLPSVMRHCDRVVVMSEGYVVEEGRPRELALDGTSSFGALLRAQHRTGDT